MAGRLKPTDPPGVNGVSKNMATRAPLETRPPWSPLSVTLITFLLPAGGAILTVWNLHRLSEFDRRYATRLTMSVIVLFVIGISALYLTATPVSQGMPTLNATGLGVLSFGVAFASYIVQRAAFQKWRTAHQRDRTSSWLPAAGLALAYTIIISLGVLPVYLVVTAVFGTKGYHPL